MWIYREPVCLGRREAVICRTPLGQCERGCQAVVTTAGGPTVRAARRCGRRSPARSPARPCQPRPVRERLDRGSTHRRLCFGSVGRHGPRRSVQRRRSRRSCGQPTTACLASGTAATFAHSGFAEPVGAAHGVDDGAGTTGHDGSRDGPGRTPAVRQPERPWLRCGSLLWGPTLCGVNNDVGPANPQSATSRARRSLHESRRTTNRACPPETNATGIRRAPLYWFDIV